LPVGTWSDFFGGGAVLSFTSVSPLAFPAVLINYKIFRKSSLILSSSDSMKW